MPAKRIPQLDILTGATSATDDKVVIFDADGNETKSITRQELGKGIVGDLPYTPSGGISATTVPAAIAELDNEAVKKSAFALVPQNFTGDGTEVDFTLSAAPISENFLWVYVQGVYQQKDSYSVSGTTLTFSEAPPVNTSIEVIRLGF